MKKATFTVNGAEVVFTEVIVVINGDETEAVLIHDENDIYNDGDVITADYAMFPRNRRRRSVHSRKQQHNRIFHR